MNWKEEKKLKLRFKSEQLSAIQTTDNKLNEIFVMTEDSFSVEILLSASFRGVHTISI